MSCSSVTNTVAMVGSKEVIGKQDLRVVVLYFVEDPHVGTQAEVLGAAITPDGEGVDASEVILLQRGEKKMLKWEEEEGTNVPS